ncbi:probable serine/threonine-protein kinase DDB_G0281745 [Dendronephthya gigantea]|uniref:probable serine/threonine-protein kinase DDB_G0281745 n=1 Tax=Dendronephthya gigantea TaxID=151771 RepID=UPI00106CFAD4|nr:probable serine/threonine-protein kinase DDB_G0281745 [Dendronephthya gigantea]
MNSEIQQLQQEHQQPQENTTSTFMTEYGTVKISNDDLLGKGAWGAVYKGDFYGTTVAVKKFHEIIISDYNKHILQREIDIASQCRHPNLLQFICATKNVQDQLLIVTELMDTALRTLLEQRVRKKSSFEYQEIKIVSKDVALGLNYLHSQKPSPIIHRDVSSANVLLTVENGAVRRAKMSDFGSANFMQVCNTPNPGAALYSAPEARRAHHDPKIDVFSYGILVCEMCICELPNQAKRKEQFGRISNANIKALVEACTRRDSKTRPAMEDAIDFWRCM